MEENIKKMIENRQEYNIKILDIIAEYIERNPEIRFGQALINLKILNYIPCSACGSKVSDPFNEESETMYNRMMNEI